MTKKKTDAEFKKEVFDLVGNEYTFLDSYVTARTRIKVKHNKCGNIYDVTPNDFTNGRRCHRCASNARKTNEQFKKEVYNLVGDEYTFLDSYINSRTEIRVKHNICGNAYKVKPSNFLTGRRCPYCNGKAKKSDHQFKKEVFDLVGDEYTFLDTYVNKRTKLRVKHNNCGSVYKVAPSNFLKGARCWNCFVEKEKGAKKKTNYQFKQEVYDLVGDEYEFLDDYVDSKTKIRVKHNKCGNIYEVAPHHFSEGHRCPYCTNSKGEDIINNILKVLGIKYDYQKTFDNLKDINLLSYDFFIPDQNILIEYQGIQHYQPFDYFGGEDKFKVQQKHDKMKADYAKEHDYTLITIPYTEDTFSKIKKYLVKHGLKLSA